MVYPGRRNVLDKQGDQAENIRAFREYSKQAILAASAVNSGAVLAVLANSGALIGSDGVAGALRLWIGGLSMATMCWLWAYMANWGFTHGRRRSESVYTALGVLFFIASVLMFGIGGWLVSNAFNLPE